MNLDRFPPPTASDDMAQCQGDCRRVLNHEWLDDDGLCQRCRQRGPEQEKEGE